MVAINPPKIRLLRTFEALAEVLAPRALRTAAEHERMVEMIDQLMRVGRLTPGQQRYVETLVVLVEAYEREHHVVPTEDLDGPEMLRRLTGESEMPPQELAELLGVSTSHVYNLLRGTRSLTVDHVRTLAKRFKVEPSLFL